MPSCKAWSCLPAASSYVCSERRADRCRSSWQQSLLPVLVRILSSAPHGTSPECQTLAPNYKLAPHQRTLVATVKTGCAAAPPKMGGGTPFDIGVCYSLLVCSLCSKAGQGNLGNARVCVLPGAAQNDKRGRAATQRRWSQAREPAGRAAVTISSHPLESSACRKGNLRQAQARSPGARQLRVPRWRSHCR